MLNGYDPDDLSKCRDGIKDRMSNIIPRQAYFKFTELGLKFT